MSALWISLHLFSIVVGRVLAAGLEWSVHRYLFHGLGKKRGSLFSFHYQQHHRSCRRAEMADPAYTGGSLLGWNPRSREIYGVFLLLFSALPIALVAPGVYLGLVYGGARYTYVHHRTHIDPDWCRAHAPWHYDHHMGPDQDQNWGVSNEWFDRLMGTRVVFRRGDA